MNSMLELCLNLANDSQLQASAQKWLTSSNFKTTLNSFAREVLEICPPSMEKVNILKTCFRVPKNGGNAVVKMLHRQRTKITFNVYSSTLQKVTRTTKQN